MQLKGKVDTNFIIDMKRILNRDFYLEGHFEVITSEAHLIRGLCCQSGCRHCPYKEKNSGPRIVSLVPSWTETLIHAGANVVGRTRFCHYPKSIITKCKIVGGTKNLSFDALKELKPQWVIMDKDENLEEMALLSPFPVLTSHVISLSTLNNELMKFSRELNLPQLESYANRLTKVIKDKSIRYQNDNFLSGLIEWWRKPSDPIKNYQLVYLIWKDPFMSVTKNTYIGSVLSFLYPQLTLWSPQKMEGSRVSNYPNVLLDSLPENSLLLFSSEPYPFQKYKEEYLQKYSYPAAFVNGESFSWFGIRSLRFLEDCIHSSQELLK